MIGLIVALLSVLLPLIHLGLSRRPRTRGRVIHLLLLYALVLDVGVIGLPLGFIPHVFFADQAARLIGWPPGSPFQFEVGIHDGAWGLLGFLCLWIGGSFWLATGLGWSVFMLGAWRHRRRGRLIKPGWVFSDLVTNLSPDRAYRLCSRSSRTSIRPTMLREWRLPYERSAEA
jgi:hypothetical protein